VRQYLELPSEPVVAIGDNDQDLEMLRAAELLLHPRTVRNSFGACGRGTADNAMPRQKDYSRHQAGDPRDGRMLTSVTYSSRERALCALIQTLMEVAERSPCSGSYPSLTCALCKSQSLPLMHAVDSDSRNRARELKSR